MEHSEQQDALKNIGCLSGMSFLVKDYQRGYRWKSTDVERLLNDLRAYGESADKTYPYCLQPIVVRKTDSASQYELFDGQQRLTTLYIILKCLGATPAFEITYTTREETSGNFLREDFYNSAVADGWEAYIKDNPGRDRIDNYHFYQAAAKVQAWRLKNPQAPQYLIPVILEDVKVIWYEPQTSQHTETSEAIFARLNVGKISLTNAELLKAHFLQHHPKRAQKWNAMEQAFEEDEFWGFLGGGKAGTATRLDVLFDLISKRGIQETETYATFSRIAEMGETAWPRVVDSFWALQNWFADTAIYHTVGTAIALGITLPDILREYQLATNQQQFEINIKQRLRNKTGAPQELNKLFYGDGRIYAVLLLANVLHAEHRFSFARYHRYDYDIEHIHATATEPPADDTAYTNWYNAEKGVLDAWPDVDGTANIGKTLAIKIAGQYDVWRAETDKEKKREVFERIYYTVQEFYDATGHDQAFQNSLCNLALLDSGINRSYGNASFAVKRAWIKDTVMNPDYKKLPALLPLTLHAFQKFHTTHPQDMMFWRQADGEAYVGAIAATLQHFYGC